MIYYNNNKEQYVLSFPEPDYIDLTVLYYDELKRKINVDKNIAVISTTTSEVSFFENQCLNNEIDFIKVPKRAVFEVLEEIEEEYVLIIKNKDAIIVNDLDSKFLEKFENLKMPFVFAGISSPIPENDIEDYRKLIVTGNDREVNASLLFGRKKDILEFYENIFLIQIPNNDFIEEQVTMRKGLMDYRGNNHINYIDSNSELFSTIIYKNNIIREKDGNRYIINRNLRDLDKILY